MTKLINKVPPWPPCHGTTKATNIILSQHKLFLIGGQSNVLKFTVYKRVFIIQAELPEF